MDELFGKLNFKSKNAVTMSQRNEPLGIDPMVSVKHGDTEVSRKVGLERLVHGIHFGCSRSCAHLID